MFPAKNVSGDFFDFFPISKEKLGFVIADVSGKGVPAALFMVMSKTLLRSAALANPSPKDCIQQVSHYLCFNNESMMFVTLFYGILDLKTGVVTYCDAGHHPPYILSSNGKLTQLKKEGGIALGILDDLEREKSHYQEQSFAMKKGDALILFTDGVTEAINKKGEPYPIKRLEEVLINHARSSLAELVNDLKDDLSQFSEGQGQYDDITLLGLRWNGE
jgi:phosphoserine phosphatase RsbU/P